MTTTLATELSSITDQAALICQTTGLTITSDLPPLPTGLYLSLAHPLATLAPTLLTSSQLITVSETVSGPSADWQYLVNLPISLKAGALLACLSNLGKVNYSEGANAYTTRLSMVGSDWNTDSLTKALSFLATRVKTSRLLFAPLTISREKGLTPEVWDDWITSIAKLDHYRANAEAKGWITLTVEEFVDQQLETNRVTKPSPAKKSKALNSEAYDAYLEFKEWLPKRTQDKAKHFVKQMATYYNGELIESFLVGVETYCTDCPDALAAYHEFTSSVRSVRSTALDKGLVDTFDGLVSDSVATAPTTTAPASKVSKTDALSQLRARLAAAKETGK